jgi:hypothetical protein
MQMLADVDKSGHTIGQSYCLFETNPARCLIWINIPKNASSWTKHHMTGTQFNYLTKTFYTDPGVSFSSIPRWPAGMTDVQYLVILRDPIDRWITGLAQYLRGWAPDHPLHINNVDWQMVFDTVHFDSHTQPQCDFIPNIDHSRTTWLRCDENLASNFSQVFYNFTGRRPTLTMPDQDPGNVFNVTEKIQPTVTELFTTARQQDIVDRIRAVLNDNPKYLDRLHTFYQQDIELFESVNFFNATTNL